MLCIHALRNNYTRESMIVNSNIVFLHYVAHFSLISLGNPRMLWLRQLVHDAARQFHNTTDLPLCLTLGRMGFFLFLFFSDKLRFAVCKLAGHFENTLFYFHLLVEYFPERL